MLGGVATHSFGVMVSPRLLAGINACLGLAMLVSGLFQQFPQWRICGWYRGVYSPNRGALVYGFLTGLNVCPPFVTAAAQVFGKGGAWEGGLYFLLFFAGTSIYFLPLLGVSWLQRHERSLPAIGRWALVLMGAYFFLVAGLLRLVSG